MPINRRDLLKITSAGGVALAGGSPGMRRGATQEAAASELTASTAAESIDYAPMIVTPTSSMEADRGTLVLPRDPRYPTLVRGFNLRWVRQPAYVAVCRDTKQVLQAVQARQETIASTRHMSTDSDGVTGAAGQGHAVLGVEPPIDIP